MKAVFVYNFMHNLKKFMTCLKTRHCYLKGVLHPRPLLGLFVHFSQKLQHIGDQLDMFLNGNILRNLPTAQEFHQLKRLLIYGSKHGKY